MNSIRTNNTIRESVIALIKKYPDIDIDYIESVLTNVAKVAMQDQFDATKAEVCKIISRKNNRLK